MAGKPHAVCIPYPAQGHINPMLKLAKLLHQKGFYITFVNTEYNHRRLTKSNGPDSLSGLPTFRFETIPDGLPESATDDSTQDIFALCKSTSVNCLGPFKELISKLNDASNNDVPRVSCIVPDGSMSFTVHVAEELGLPQVMLWTASTSSFLCFTEYRNLIRKGYVPLKDKNDIKNGYLDTPIDWIPSMKGIRLKDFPSFIRTTDPDDFMLKYCNHELDNAHRASAIIFNSFEELEKDFFESLRPDFPPIYPIGPLHLHINQIDENDDLKLIGSNLWKEDHKCLDWLDTKEQNSVVYVNFGSITVMTPEQLLEFAEGLAKSNMPFLWVIRQDLVIGDVAVVPPDFIETTKDRAYISGWCPQDKVLRHPSIGVFLTHSGWNSTLESLSYGVPIVSWPFFGDQQTNCWFCCSKLGVGLEIDNEVKRDKVENIVREMLVGEKGKEMKKRAVEWKRLAHEAVEGSSGSSVSNLDEVVNKVLLSPRR